MEAFGYDKKDVEYDDILKLSQVTLNCKREDLEKIIEFLNKIKRESENEKIEGCDHWHYRDYSDSWTEEESDLIIFIDEGTN